MPPGPQGVAEIVVGFSEVGMKVNGATMGGDGLVERTFIAERGAEIVVGFRVVGIEGDGLAISGDCVIEKADGPQSGAKIVVGPGKSRI